MNSRNLLALLGGLLASDVVMAQDEEDFNLFEATEQQAQEQSAEVVRAVREPPNREPAFTLKGTSRFGDAYTASLVARDGSAVQVNWGQAQRVQVPNHAGFQVVDVKSRAVSIELPPTEACVPSKPKGVDCSSDGRVAMLTLATATPLAVRQPQATRDVDPFAQAVMESGDAVEVVDGEPSQGLPVNPFSGEPQVPVQISDEERQARAARQAARMRALQNFQPVRIPDDQVPPGMRKVETPFGDRLVPDER